MVGVHQHLGLDDRDDPGLLAERGVARERLGVDPDAVAARQAVADGQGGPPLGEPGAQLVVLGEPLAEAVEALRDRLAGRAGQRLHTGVDLDPRHDALGGEELRERRPVVGLLADRLVEEDDAADELLHPLGREQEIAVGAPVRLGRLDRDRVEALLDRARRLVCGEDAPVVLHDRPCDRPQL